jgi:site-specific DNA recombinase
MGYICKDGELVIAPEEAEIVRKIFEIYLDGKSLI